MSYSASQSRGCATPGREPPAWLTLHCPSHRICRWMVSALFLCGWGLGKEFGAAVEVHVDEFVDADEVNAALAGDEQWDFPMPEPDQA